MKSTSLLPLLILMVIFSPLAIDIFLPALPLMASELSVPLSQLQWSVGVFILSLGLGQLLSGPLADRYGRRPIALVGIIIYMLSSILTAYSNSLELLLFSRLLQGFGACAIVVAAFACVRDRYDALRSGVMYSYLNGAISCIPALAPILGNLLTEAFGWRSNFWFMAGYAVVAGVIITLFLKETRPANTVRHPKLITVESYLPVLVHPVFLFNATAVTLSMAIIIAYVSSSPGWLMVELGLNQQDFVFWFSLNAAFNIVACLLAPRALQIWGARLTIGSGMLTLIGSGLMMVMMLKWQNPMGFMLPVMFSSIGFSLLMGACSGQALAPFGEKAGTASALLGFLQMSGAAVIVFCIQMLPLNAIEQLSLLMLSVLPLYIIWKLPATKKRIA